MQVLASLGAVLGDDDTRRRLVGAATAEEVYTILTAR